ncbi:MAG: cbb3-type cytochrome oxidase assembly protein [Anaerolineales bacterium]|nr:cbb3-type cytochrome oxidase assembly protein [Anaerolineales bacterium]
MVYAGTWLILATTAIIIVIFLTGVYWAWRNGQFEDFEAIKYRIFDDDLPRQ